MNKSSSLNLVYGIEYFDDEDCDYFYIYHTIFRNVPLNHLNRMNDKNMHKRVKSYCDKNFNETATNATGHTKVQMIHGDHYYKTYDDVFGKDIVGVDNSLYKDYGQLWNTRQFFKRDWNPKLTEQYTYQNLNAVDKAIGIMEKNELTKGHTYDN